MFTKYNYKFRLQLHKLIIMPKMWLKFMASKLQTLLAYLRSTYESYDIIDIVDMT